MFIQNRVSVFAIADSEKQDRSQMTFASRGFVMLWAIATTLVLCVLAGGWLHTQQNAVDTRQTLAESWGSPSAYFAAVGLRGENLTVFLPDGDNVECDAFLGSVSPRSRVD
jgi:hypothetical protein